MAKTEFANTIIQKLAETVGKDGSQVTAETALACQSAIAAALTEYIVANTTVTIAYTGVTPSGSPDPLVVDTMKVTGVFAPLGVAADLTSWGAVIPAGLTIFAAPISTNGITAPIMPFNPAGVLVLDRDRVKSATDGASDIQLAVWEEICQQIMDYINSPSTINPMMKAIPGAHATISSGTVSLTQISIS